MARPNQFTSALAYSYGEGNAYGHPFDETRKAHREAGWEIVGQTAFGRGEARGHLGIPLIEGAALRCGGERCTLAVRKRCNAWRSEEAVAELRDLFKEWEKASGVWWPPYGS